MAYVLALDQSTSATKALLFDAAGRCLDFEAANHRQYHPQAGWVEHDADEIWQNALATLRAVARRQAHCWAETVCLSLTNQRETVVVFERRTGRPLHPAMVWQCQRGQEYCRQHLAAGAGPLVQRKTGLPIDAYFSASKLEWLVHHQPAIARQLASGEALIGTIDSYLIYRLTGGRVFATDATNASRTLLFDLHRRDWDDELCALWRVPRCALPEIRDTDALFGETTLDGALAVPLRICGVIGDSQGSLLAQRCFRVGSGKATFGTGTSVLLNIGDTPRPSPPGIATALAWQLQGRPTYACEGIIISSASTLTWLRDQLGLVPHVQDLEHLAAQVPDHGGVYLVPAFSGLGLPHWQRDARAAILGLSSQSDRRHVARAAMDSIAYQVRDALTALRDGSGVAVAALHADGGATTNRPLMQFLADITRATIRVSAMPHGSPLGATFAGLLGTGVLDSLAALDAIEREETVYEPGMTESAAAQLHQGWASAVRAVLAQR